MRDEKGNIFLTATGFITSVPTLAQNLGTALYLVDKVREVVTRRANERGIERVVVLALGQAELPEERQLELTEAIPFLYDCMPQAEVIVYNKLSRGSEDDILVRADVVYLCDGNLHSILNEFYDHPSNLPALQAFVKRGGVFVGSGSGAMAACHSPINWSITKWADSCYQPPMVSKMPPLLGLEQVTDHDLVLIPYYAAQIEKQAQVAKNVFGQANYTFLRPGDYLRF